MQQGGEVIVVSSGAIACGLHRLGAPEERKDIPFRQVLASVGQTYLMRAYEELFAWHDIVVAQTLLTRRDLADRQGYLNARNTLLALLEVRAVPIVNENDVVAGDEIEGLAGAGGVRGVGGMATKVQAARLATAGGTNVAIADGHERDILARLA